jgi:hypothetical protein
VVIVFELFCMVETCFRFELLILKAEDHLYHNYSSSGTASRNRTSESQSNDVNYTDPVTERDEYNNDNNIELTSLVDSVNLEQGSMDIVKAYPVCLNKLSNELSSREYFTARTVSEPASSRVNFDVNVSRKGYQSKSFIL